MSEDIEIIPVHPTKLDAVWPVVEPWLVKAMEHGGGLYAPEDVLEACRRTEFILWIALDVERDAIIGMTVTSLDVYPRKKVATIRWGGGNTGDGRRWLHDMVVVLKGWGKHFGADTLGGAGRRGWLRGYGFKERGCLFEDTIQ